MGFSQHSLWPGDLRTQRLRENATGFRVPRESSQPLGLAPQEGPHSPAWLAPSAAQMESRDPEPSKRIVVFFLSPGHGSRSIMTCQLINSLYPFRWKNTACLFCSAGLRDLTAWSSSPASPQGSCHVLTPRGLSTTKRSRDAAQGCNVSVKTHQVYDTVFSDAVETRTSSSGHFMQLTCLA